MYTAYHERNDKFSGSGEDAEDEREQCRQVDRLKAKINLGASAQHFGDSHPGDDKISNHSTKIDDGDEETTTS